MDLAQLLHKYLSVPQSAGVPQVPCASPDTAELCGAGAMGTCPLLSSPSSWPCLALWDALWVQGAQRSGELRAGSVHLERRRLQGHLRALPKPTGELERDAGKGAAVTGHGGMNFLLREVDSDQREG